MARLLFKTSKEYDDEIADVQIDIKRVRKLGSKHKNDSGGSSRETEEVSLESLLSYKTRLIEEQCVLNGNGGGSSIRARW